MEKDLPEEKIMSAPTKGLLLGLLLVVLSITLYVLMPNMEEQQKYSWLTFVLIVGGIVWAGYKYAQDMKGNVTFGAVFSHSFKATAVLTLIVIGYFILAVTVVFPEMKDKAMELALQQLEKAGTMNDAQIKQTLDMQSEYFLPFGIAGQLVGCLVLGAIGGLIAGLISKKNPNPSPF